MTRRTAPKPEGAPDQAHRPSPRDGEPQGQPDPVTLCEPTYDESGRLRWGSTRS